MLGWLPIACSQQTDSSFSTSDYVRARKFKVTLNTYKTVHKTNPLSLVVGNTAFNGELRYMNETVISPKSSLMISASYLFKSVLVAAFENSRTGNPLNNPAKLSVNGFRFQLGQRFYPLTRKPSPEGFWVGPHLSMLNLILKPLGGSGNDKIEVWHVNMNLHLGYQFIVRRFVVDFYAGLGVKHNSWRITDNGSVRRFDEIYEAFPLYAVPIKLSFGSNWGIAF